MKNKAALKEKSSSEPKVKARWTTCPECEANFLVLPKQPLPPHRAFNVLDGSRQCDGVGRVIRN